MQNTKYRIPYSFIRWHALGVKIDVINDIVARREEESRKKTKEKGATNNGSRTKQQHDKTEQQK